MILVYVVLAILLGMVSFVVSRRAKRAQSLYHKEELNHNQLLHGQPNVVNYNDPGHLVRIAMVSDSIKTRNAAMAHNDKCQGHAEAVGGLRQTLKGWRGRKAPYVLGFLDAVGMVGAIDFFGLHGQIGESIVTFAKTLFSTAG